MQSLIHSLRLLVNLGWQAYTVSLRREHISLDLLYTKLFRGVSCTHEHILAGQASDINSVSFSTPIYSSIDVPEIDI